MCVSVCLCVCLSPCLTVSLSSTADVTGEATLPESVQMVMPGDNVTATFELIMPVAMEQGLRCVSSLLGFVFGSVGVDY